MKLECTLYQRGYLLFVIFFVFVLVGFWLTYFTRLFHQENYRMHLHGIVLIMWCLLLIVQPYLIYKHKTRLHKQLGRVSYVLVPLIAFTTIDLFKYRLSELTVLSMGDYLFVASVLVALLTFLFFYGLAMYHRKQPAVHGRYMLCTIFPMFTAIIDRIITNYFPSVLAHLPSVDGPVVQVVGLVLGDILLLMLCVWDWRSHRRWNVFPVALGIHLFYHFAVMNFHQYKFWRLFSVWFFEL